MRVMYEEGKASGARATVHLVVTIRARVRVIEGLGFGLRLPLELE